MSRTKKPVSERFWEKVDIRGDNECWNWTGSTNNGYGQFGINGLVKRTHQMAYILTYGDITPGKQILVNCGNKLCCNPAHLSEGNQYEKVSELRSISSDKIRRIQVLYSYGYTAAQIARKLGIDNRTVYKYI